MLQVYKVTANIAINNKKKTLNFDPNGTPYLVVRVRVHCFSNHVLNYHQRRTYGHMYRRTMPSLCLDTLVPRQTFTPGKHSLLCRI